MCDLKDSPVHPSSISECFKRLSEDLNHVFDVSGARRHEVKVSIPAESFRKLIQEVIADPPDGVQFEVRAIEFGRVSVRPKVEKLDQSSPNGASK